MKKEMQFFWRFTLVNRFSLEKVTDVFCFGSSLTSAVRNLRRLFPVVLYDVDEVMQVQNSHVVVAGYSNLEDLIDY